MPLTVSNKSISDAKKTLTLSPDKLKAVIDSCFNYIELCLLRKELVSDSVASSLPLCIILNEALRQNSTEDDLKIFLLETLEFNEELCDYFSTRYCEKKDLLRSYMQGGFSINYPHIVDCKWRLDSAVKSDNCEIIKEPRYFISLTLRHDRGNLSTLTFTCSLEGLQDLVQSLKQACKSVEKAANFTV